MTIQEVPFGTNSRGEKVRLFILETGSGTGMKVMDSGGVITSFTMPDKKGKIEELTCGFESISEYETKSSYFGAAIGRFGNRISKGNFNIDGKKYTLPLNDGVNHLHGGPGGFHQKIWDTEIQAGNDEISLVFSLSSESGEEGYPGNMDVTMTYTLSESGTLTFDYRAVCDEICPINLTNHTYWNLAGPANETIINHEMTLNCPFYLPVNEVLIPTGEIRSVINTPFDFSIPRNIGDSLKKTENGFDHCFVREFSSEYMGLTAHARHPGSGRNMNVYTNQPGIQFYTGNFLKNVSGRNGVIYKKNSAFCLETQNFPDAPNNMHFPSAFLKPGEEYRHTTRHEFYLDS